MLIAVVAIVVCWVIWGGQVAYFVLVGSALGLLWAALRRAVSEPAEERLERFRSR